MILDRVCFLGFVLGWLFVDIFINYKKGMIPVIALMIYIILEIKHRRTKS